MAASGDAQHYFDADPDAPADRRSVAVVLPDLTVTLATDSGVFGRHRLDPGTKLLLIDGPAPTPGDANLLDLGCGYGPIAITLASRNPAATIWAVDVNARARALCAENVDAAGLTNVRVVGPDDVPDTVRFDRIWSNPPIRIGKAQLHELLERWLARLAPDGSAHLVVQKHLGADSLHRWLEGGGRTVVRRGSKAGYRLLDVGPGPPEAPGTGSA